jgi:predicted nucleotidyltransferase
VIKDSAHTQNLNISMIFHTNMEKIKVLFYKQAVKRWHFEEIVTSSGMSRERVNHYLKQLCKEHFIKRIKPCKKMPYYTANRSSEQFRFEKKLYGLQQLQKIGLFSEIKKLKEIKTAILFGSFARGDWNKSSDIDLFIYGNTKNFEKGELEKKLNREIQLFAYTKPKHIKKDLDHKLIPNIAKGYYIKGGPEPFEVSICG